MYEQIGNIAIIDIKKAEKLNLKRLKNLAKKILSKHIKTVILKQKKIKGRFRKANYKFLAGEKCFETFHKENGCIFKLNIKDVYFSSRLASNRLWLAKKILDLTKKKKRKKIKILVGFAGVGAYGIVIARELKLAGIDFEMVMVEINRKAVKYMKENILLNKLNIKIIQGDVREVFPKLNKFDFIIMPRPQLAYDFFNECFINAKKDSIVFYFDFLLEQEIEKRRQELESKAKVLGKKIKILEIKKAGEIGVRKWRVVVVFEISN